MAEEIVVRKKRDAWEADPNAGYGKHAYRHIDPETINPADYARAFRGEEKHFGDVREYNTASNLKHEETTLDLYDLGLLRTKFSTEAKGFEGEWVVVDFPKVVAPNIWTRVQREVDGELSGETVEISIVDLGVGSNAVNLFEQVITKLIKRGAIDREQRMRLKTGTSTRDRLWGKSHGESTGDENNVGTTSEEDTGAAVLG